MANPMKACESCNGTGKVVDNAKRTHQEATSNISVGDSKKRTGPSKDHKPQTPSTRRGKK